MEFAERAETKPLGNDIFAAAIHLITVVAMIAWVAGNRGAENVDALAP
jgi:hypothetical protein